MFQTFSLTYDSQLTPINSTTNFDISKLEQLEQMPRSEPNMVIEKARELLKDPDLNEDPNLRSRVNRCIGYANCYIVGTELTAVHSIREINSLIHRHFGKLMPIESCSIGLYNESENTLEYTSPIVAGHKTDDKSVSLADNYYPSLSFELSRDVLIKSKDEIKLHVKFMHNYNQEEDKNPSESIICVPLVQEGQNIGVIHIGTSQKNAYSSLELEFVKNLCAYVVVAIQNTRSFNNLSRLSLVGQEVLRQTSVRGITDLLHERLSSFLDASIFYIGLYNKSEDALVLPRIYEKGEVSFEDYVLSGMTNTSIGLYCVRTDHAFHGGKFDDLKKYIPNYAHDASQGDPPESIIAIPLVYQDEIKGMISVQSWKKKAYTREQFEIMKTIASFVSTTIHNIDTHATLSKLSIVASKTDNAIMIADAAGEIEWINDAYQKFFGQDLEQMKSGGTSSIPEVSSLDEIDDILKQVHSSKQSVNYETVIFDSDGKKKYVQTTLTPLVDEEGAIQKLIAIDSDITFQKKAELEIRAMNKDLTDSINYARRIQNAMLPGEEFLKKDFPDSFVYFEPKDIVSGDFYWMYKTENDELIIAAVDCTGHGVPGAFLTIVGNNLLNQIVIHDKITSPGKILEEMNIQLLDRLHTTEDKKVRDGMDAAICTIVKNDKGVDLTFAGAYNPMYYYLNEEMMELAANRNAVGTPIKDKAIVFDEESLTLPSGAMIYLFSDGYHDQLGGPKGKKFMKKRFKELLQDISNESASAQKEKLEEAIEEWSGSHNQVDDILVMGIKI